MSAQPSPDIRPANELSAHESGPPARHDVRSTNGEAPMHSHVAVTDDRKRSLLGDALGAAASEVDYVDRDSFYSRPEAALAGYDKRVRQLLRDGATAVRVFGEPPLAG